MVVGHGWSGAVRRVVSKGAREDDTHNFNHISYVYERMYRAAFFGEFSP